VQGLINQKAHEDFREAEQIFDKIYKVNSSSKFASAFTKPDILNYTKLYVKKREAYEMMKKVDRLRQNYLETKNPDLLAGLQNSLETLSDLSTKLYRDWYANNAK
jgi:hypothetical protein